MTEQAAAEVLSSQQEAISLLQQLQGASSADASSIVLDQLRRDPLVSECRILSDGTIWARYSTGLETEILGTSAEADFVLAGSVVASGGSSRRSSTSPASDRSGQGRTAAAKTALFLLPFSAEEDAAARYVQDLLRSAGFTIHGPFEGTAVTVELMRAMSAHRVVYITTHGSPDSLMTGQKVLSPDDLAMMWNRDKSRIGVAFPAGSWVPYYTIKPAFIRDLRYPASLIFANACSTLAEKSNSQLARAFIDSGASVYCGWDAPAYITEWCTGQAARRLFEDLLTPGTTVAAAFAMPNAAPEGITTAQRFSLDDFYPVRVYNDTNHNGNGRICYDDLGGLDTCVGDPGDVTLDHAVDFLYEGDGGFVLVPGASPSQSTILIDASRDGGVWWYPQVAPFSSMAPHQGKNAADHLRTQGYDVVELPRLNQTITESLLAQASVVIRAGNYGAYEEEEVQAYTDYVRMGGHLLLLADCLRSWTPPDAMSLAFGIRWEGVSRGESVLVPVGDHAIVSGVDRLPYIGSGATLWPDGADILGHLSPDTYLDMNDNDQRDPGEPSGSVALGAMAYGTGKLVFCGDVNLFEQESAFRLIDNILAWFRGGS